MILSDNITNTDIFYTYVKKFKWSHPVSNETFGGHPKDGRVYRVIKNTDTNTYRLIYGRIGGTGQGVMLESLTSSDESVGYTSDIVPITRANILDLEISEEDLDLLKIWTDTDNRDIKEIFELKNQPPPPSLPPPAWVQPNDLTEFVSCASELQSIDPTSFDTIHELIHALNEPPNEPIEVLNMRMNRNFGGGANMVKVFEHLTRYMGDDRRTNQDKNDLLEAQKYITYEINRLKLAQ